MMIDWASETDPTDSAFSYTRIIRTDGKPNLNQIEAPKNNSGIPNNVAGEKNDNLYKKALRSLMARTGQRIKTGRVYWEIDGKAVDSSEAYKIIGIETPYQLQKFNDSVHVEELEDRVVRRVWHESGQTVTATYHAYAWGYFFEVEMKTKPLYIAMPKILELRSEGMKITDIAILLGFDKGQVGAGIKRYRKMLRLSGYESEAREDSGKQ